MDINLTIIDMDNFLNKYTRFITKDIYITNKMYNQFFSSYNYLFEILKKERFLYNDNKLYKKTIDILENKVQLIKLHNKKYLQKSLEKYKTFFDNLNLSDKLDTRKKTIILCEEENAYIVEPKNQETLIVGKINYLLKEKKYSPKDILILTDNKNINTSLKEKCNHLKINIKCLKEYSRNLLTNEPILNHNKKYNILIQYLMTDLFEDKDKFNSFYKAFSKYIYLNKDYKEYQTFKDYHNYMYKRKYLSSKLSLKKFNELEIKTRRTYLRTIKNEIMKNKDEVDIANFLYLNSIYYTYDSADSIFKINLSNKENYIKYIDESEQLDIKNTYTDSTIYLYSSYTEKKTSLEVLAYELIKRRYPLELINEDEVYKALKDTNIENYFSEFVNKHLIPLIDNYEEYKTLNNTKLDSLKQEEFLKLYDIYKIKTNNHITKKKLLKIIEQEIISNKYKYLLLMGDIPLQCNIPTLTITPSYPETTLLKENIKLLYDYKKYLYQNQILPITHAFIAKNELNNLTSNFLKDNLMIINKQLKENTKEIEAYGYEDTNRLHIYKNITTCCSNIIEQHPTNTLIALKQLKDINSLIGNKTFTKLNKNTLLNSNKDKIQVEEILKITKLYDNVILPNLIPDNYHEELIDNNYQYNLKVMLYVALNKCRKKLIILYPKSKKQEIKELLSKLKKSRLV